MLPPLYTRTKGQQGLGTVAHVGAVASKGLVVTNTITDSSSVDSVRVWEGLNMDRI